MSDHRAPLFRFVCFLFLIGIVSTPLIGIGAEVLPLWPEGAMPGLAPKVEGEERDLTVADDRLIAGKRIIKLGHVARPEIHVFLPPEEKRNGSAVVICPGGGFHILAWDLEGTEVAEWLNGLGIAAVVVKYRVPTAEHGNVVETAPGDAEVKAPVKAIGSLMDAQRALSMTRANAEAWGIDPERVGVMGFSAGGETAALAAVSLGKRAFAPIDAIDEASCAADFAMLIYPGGLADRETGELRSHFPVSEATPPMFFVHAADDRVTPLASSALFEALELSGVPAELHIFATGGHGYGLRPTEAPVTHWPNRAVKWLREMDLLGGVGSVASGDGVPGEKREGNPADHLPPWIRRLTWIGERPDWRHDGERVLFVSKVYGDVYEYEIGTGRIRSLSDHFLHYGFTRAQYLASGDVLLVGPAESFDRKDREDRKRARHEVGRMYLLKQPFDRAPHDLGVEADEGPAVSRSTMKIAWTHGEQAEISTAKIVYDDDGTPRLAEVKKVIDLSDFPTGTRMIETQNFLPTDDRVLTVSAYQIAGTDDTDCFTFDLGTGELVNHTPVDGFYNEPEGVFPDGESTLVEHGSVAESHWPLIDLYRLRLDGSGAMERLTHFSEFAGYKASQGVISDDGRQMIFQIGKSGDEAGQGYGFFLYDFERRAEFREKAITAYAREQAKRKQAGEAIGQFSVAHPDATADEAETTQRVYVSALVAGGEEIAGIKGAVVGEGGQKFFGIDGPLSAVLFRSGWHEAGQQVVRVPVREGANPGIETELGIILDQPIREEVASIEELKEKVRAVVAVIELPAGKHDWPEKPKAIDLVAANVDSDHYIVGIPAEVGAVELDALEVRLWKGDELINETNGGDARRGQWWNFLHQVNWAIRQGYRLEPGQLVITGALGKIAKEGPGRYRANFGELGEIAFELHQDGDRK